MTVYWPETEILRSAVISDCSRFRFSLKRTWGASADGRLVVWLMLNPSTADHQSDDPTVKRCIQFSNAWGFDGLEIINLYPFRASRPADLWAWLNGPMHSGDRQALIDNLKYIEAAASRAEMRVAAFGTDVLSRGMQSLLPQWDALRGAGEVYCLGLSPSGGPLHPMARGKYRVQDGVSPLSYEIAPLSPIRSEYHD